MKKFYHRKLIRDKIPHLIEANKGRYEARIMKEDEFKKELRKKIGFKVGKESLWFYWNPKKKC